MPSPMSSSSVLSDGLVEWSHEGAELGDTAGERLVLVQHHAGDIGVAGGPIAGGVGGGEES